MAKSIYRQITAGFETDKAREQAKQTLQERRDLDVKILTFEPSTIPSLKAAQGTKQDLTRAAFSGGLMGAFVGGIITVFALNVPNLPTLETNAIGLMIVLPLGGIIIGAATGSLFSVLSGALPSQVCYEYQLIVKIPVENVETVTAILLEQEGHLQ